MQVRQHIFAKSKPLIKILLVKITWLASERVEHQSILFLRDSYTWYIGSGTLRQLDSLLSIPAIIEPELDLKLVQIETHSYCAWGCRFKTGEMLSLGYGIVNSEFYIKS